MVYLNKYLAEVNKLPDFCRRYFDAKQDKFTASTKYVYAVDLKIFFEWMATKLDKDRAMDITLADLDELTEDDINSYLSYLNKYEYEGKIYTNTEAGKARKITTLRSFFKYFKRRELIKQNVMELIDIPKIKEKAIVVLSPNEQKDIFDVAETGSNKSDRAKQFHEKTVKRNMAILTLFLGTGIRVSELVNINDEDVDFKEQRILIIRKGGDKQFVYFGNEVSAALLEYMEEERATLMGYKNVNDIPMNSPLFVSLKHQRITTRMVENIIKDIAKAVVPSSVKITPHTLRKTYGTMLYYRYKDIYLTQKALGHTTPQTTIKYYTKFNEEQLKQLKDYEPNN